MRSWTWLLLPAALVGCSGVPPNYATLHLTLDGDPLDRAEVRLYPKTDLDLGSYLGTTDENGMAIIQGDSRFPDAIRPGEYSVVVRLPDSPPVEVPGAPQSPRSLPSRYGDRTDTPLSVEIRPGTNTPPTLELISNKS
jgi:hypothetical protein